MPILWLFVFIIHSQLPIPLHLIDLKQRGQLQSLVLCNAHSWSPCRKDKVPWNGAAVYHNCVIFICKYWYTLICCMVVIYIMSQWVEINVPHIYVDCKLLHYDMVFFCPSSFVSVRISVHRVDFIPRYAILYIVVSIQSVQYCTIYYRCSSTVVFVCSGG